MEEADPARAPRARFTKLRVGLWLVLLCASVLSVCFFEATDPLECGEGRDPLHPREWLGLSLSMASLVVLIVLPPRIRLRDKPDPYTATALMVTITIILGIYLFLSGTPVC